MILLSALAEVERTVERVDNRNYRAVVVPDEMWEIAGLREGPGFHLWLTTNERHVVRNEVWGSYTSEWRDYWGLTASFQDSPGVLARLAALLAELQIDIVSCRAETTEPNGIVTAELVVDAYRNPSQERLTFRALRAHVIGRFIREIVFYEGQPQILLWRILTPPNRQRSHVVSLGRRRISIPITFLEDIRKSTAPEHPSLNGDPGARLMAALRVDTEAGVTRAMILFPGTRHLALRIWHEDEIGSLHQVAEFMREHDLNMIQLRTDIPADEDIAMTEVILKVPVGNAWFHVVDESTAGTIARALRSYTPIVTLCEPSWLGV